MRCALASQATCICSCTLPYFHTPVRRPAAPHSRAVPPERPHTTGHETRLAWAPSHLGQHRRRRHCGSPPPYPACLCALSTCAHVSLCSDAPCGPLQPCLPASACHQTQVCPASLRRVPHVPGPPLCTACISSDAQARHPCAAQPGYCGAHRRRAALAAPWTGYCPVHLSQALLPCPRLRMRERAAWLQGEGT
jgi:hypothetical protein